MPPAKSLGTLGDIMSDVPSVPKNEPITLAALAVRVETLESALQMVIEELTALRASVERLEKPSPKSKATPKPTKPSKRKPFHPWDDPEILKELDACRPRILELLSDEKEITKQGCADVLNIDASLAGRTLTVKKEIQMISSPPTQDDPNPKKRFCLK